MLSDSGENTLHHVYSEQQLSINYNPTWNFNLMYIDLDSMMEIRKL